MTAEELRQRADQLIENGEYAQVKPLLLSYKDVTEHDNELAMTCYLCTIYDQEAAAGQVTLFDKVSNVAELIERYTRLKFYLRRIDFDIFDENFNEDMKLFYEFLSACQISSYELLRTIDFSVVHKDKVLRCIKGEMPDGENMEKSIDKSTDKSDGKQDTRYEGYDKDISDVSALDEFCFIICTNNRAYADECIYYIEHLHVPEGVRIDVLTVEEAKSLASAYNEAMRYSPAKYKVYLHQDTFIINPDFICDCLEIFRKNPQIGMIGNIGVTKMPDSGIMWDTDRYGMLYEQHIYETELLSNVFSPDLPYLETEAIDGFIMITQYDIPWREDLFTNWDFYDCSQSMEFRRHGYQVVVPNMKEPWCVHDCGFINLKKYDNEREKFVREYLH